MDQTQRMTAWTIAKGILLAIAVLVVAWMLVLIGLAYYVWLTR